MNSLHLITNELWCMLKDVISEKHLIYLMRMLRHIKESTEYNIVWEFPDNKSIAFVLQRCSNNTLFHLEYKLNSEMGVCTTHLDRCAEQGTACPIRNLTRSLFLNCFPSSFSFICNNCCNGPCRIEENRQGYMCLPGTLCRDLFFVICVLRVTFGVSKDVMRVIYNNVCRLYSPSGYTI